MRAPRWLRDLFGWRWAPFVALVAASLSFVLLIALLMPTDLGGVSHRVSASPAFVRQTAERPSAPEAPTHVVVAAERPPSEAPELAPPSAPEAAAQASPGPEPDPVGSAVVDYAANIADRGDRPHAPAARFSGH